MPLLRRAAPLLVLLAVAGFPAPAGAIIGGTPTARPRASFVVALVDAAQGGSTIAAGQFCAATAVRPDALVTAAHCLADEDGSPIAAADLRIFTGHVLPLRTGRLARVRSVALNPAFDDGAGEADADVGVVRLARPLRGVTPIPVAGPRDAPSWRPGAPLTLFGWGNRAKGDGENFPRQLQEGTVARIGDQRCDDLYGRAFNAAAQLCAGTPDGAVDSCQGDSGGPLTATRPGGALVLVGVVSYGQGCGDPLFPTVYTKLSRYRPFLARALARRR